MKEFNLNSAAGFDRRLERYERNGWGDRHLAFSIETANKVSELITLLSEKLQPAGDDEYNCFWFCLPKGTLEDYGDPQEAIEDGAYDSESEFEEEWKDIYPDDEYWYLVEVKRYKDYLTVWVNSNNFISIEPAEDNEYRDRIDETESVEFLLEKAKEAIAKIEAGTYREWLEESLPKRYRFGDIPMPVYWKLRPEEKEYAEERMPAEEAERFKKAVDEDGEYDYTLSPKENFKYFLANHSGFLRDMTPAKYLEISAIGYRALYQEEISEKNMSELDMYRRWADGRDGGFLQLPKDDTAAFKAWYLLDSEEKWKIENPSHLWEAIQGGSRTRMHLTPHLYSGEWFFTISPAEACPHEAAIFYLALREAGIPVLMYDAKKIAANLAGEGYVGIVPCYKEPYLYLYGGFPREGVQHFINIRSDDKDIEEAAGWYAIKGSDAAVKKA